ncbi:hypothetical protein DNTS_030266 [Danionella cerebrum]|uniref:C2H2-type domain-containing protein n=1 Tax=Danionella cerebrum TaxID=2873325 RepID=A0A553NW78_9TELE|nr:hypothetical protein DNTS_030266 [Danionella translucida]
MLKMADNGNDGELKISTKDDLQTLKELVNKLYTFRDHYFDTHCVEDAGRKQNDVLQEMTKTLERLEEKADLYKNSAQFLLLRGRCLNVAQGFSKAAEECLSRAVKLDPGLNKNKVSLRSLSMVLRQLPPEGDALEQSKRIIESVELARQAVQLDVADGTSWYILGNAYISMFFSSGQKPQLSQQALSAYAQAEKIDKASSTNPDLHFNRATLFQYEEMYSSALDGYSRAAALDPAWEEAHEREKQLLSYLDQGKVKARRLRNMLASLSSPALGPCSSPQFRSPSGRVGSLEPCSLASLTHGNNTGVAAIGKVVFSLASENRMTFTFGMVGSDETCCLVMVYNTANSWGVLIGDTVVIPEPQVKRHSVTHKQKSYDFRSIRVDSPLLLIVNGKRQVMESQSAAFVTYKPQTCASGRVQLELSALVLLNHKLLQLNHLSTRSGHIVLHQQSLVKRPQQLVNADPGGTSLMPQDDQDPMKSPSTSLASEATSSSSSPTSLQDCQPPLAPRPSPGGLHAPSLPNESSSPPHWTNHISSYSTSLPNAHSSLSPDFPHPSLSSQTHSPPPGSQKSSHTQSHNHHSAVASPPMGISATTATSSFSSSSSQGVPTHQGSPSPIHQTPSSPSDQLQMTPTLAVLLEELRVLQQRQIHQMQITEEICRQVLRLGGIVSTPDAPQGAVDGHSKDVRSSSPPKTISAGSLVNQAPTSKPSLSQTNGTRTPYSSTPSSMSSSSLVTSSASPHPLSLTLGLPPRYLSEKSPHTSITHGNGLTFPTPPRPTVSLSQDQITHNSTVSTSNGSSSSSGRQQHICRFCGKVLSSDSSLQIHLRSHTGERPYQCPVCLSRFTTRGNLKAHFLRHREQNPELSLSLLPPALSEQSQSGSGSGGSQRRRKRRAEDEDSFGIKGSVGVPDSLALSFLSGPSHPSPSSLPLPPSVDLALLSTAHSLLQLNRASAVASVSTSSQSPSSSITSSAMAGQLKAAKQQRFDENTPPHSTLHPGSPYSQLAHLPKILFPSGPSAHHPSLALLRPPHLSSPHLPLAFPFASYPKPQNSSPPSSSPSSSSDTSKLQRLAQKLEKQPLPKSTNEGQTNTQANDISTSANGNAISAYRREMMAALGLNPIPGSEPTSQELQGSTATSLVPNQCGVCLRVLSCPRALRLHQATHLGERPFPCKLCGRSFSTKGSLRAHLATHRARPANARGQNSCPLCQRKFTNAVVLQHHIRMHLGGQLPPEGNGDIPSGEDLGQIDGVSLPKTLQSLPLNMSMSSSASILESGASLRDTISSDADGLMESDQDPYDNTPETSPTLSKQDPSSENSPVDALDENHYGAVHQITSQAINGSGQEDEDAPLSLCTRIKSQDTLLEKKWQNGTSNHTVLSGPKPSSNSEALDLSPALTPPSSPGMSTDSKSDQNGVQTTMNGIDNVVESDDHDSNTTIESPSVHANIPERAEELKAEDTHESKTDQSFEEDQRKGKEKTEVTSSGTPVPLQQPQRSEKPYSCTECGKEYASRSGLKGHMKVHSGSLSQIANPAPSQSSGVKAVERMAELTHRKLRGDDAKNLTAENTDKTFPTEPNVPATDRNERIEDTV